MDKAKLKKLAERIEELRVEVEEALKDKEPELPECFKAMWHQSENEENISIYCLARGSTFEIATAESKVIRDAICALPDLIRASLQVIDSEARQTFYYDGYHEDAVDNLKEAIEKAGVKLGSD